jgi:thiosulfate/3-mercaptopyruvate sulfurtransferase
MTRDIATDEIRQHLGDPSFTIVDVRSIAAYNGWRLEGEARGGHIPGAVSFPFPWLDSIEDREIDRLLLEKRVTPDRTIVLYGYRPEQTAGLAARLEAAGHQNVLVYGSGFAAWAADPSLALERLPKFDRLVHTGWLSELLAGGRPEAYDNDKFVLLHVNFGVPEEYAENHLPGAVYLDTNWIEDPATWNRRSAAEIEETLLALGIRHDTTVIVYGRDTVGDANEKWPGRRAGQIAASRAALILRYAGVEDVRLLDGGYDWWVTDGHPLDVEPVQAVPVTDFGVSIPQHPEYLVDLPEAKEILADQDRAALVSVRTWREHIGAVSGYNYIGPAGRIKGDVWGNCGTDAYHMQHYRGIDNKMRAYPEIVANWAEADITPDKWVAFYCGTGWRAAETWFYADLLDWQRVAVYDGGWFEWSQDPINNPIEIGVPAEVVADSEAAA